MKISQAQNIQSPFRKTVAILFKDKTAVIALFIITAYFLTAFAGEFYCIYCRITKTTPIYQQNNINDRYKAPSRNYLMGTDYQGRSVFWRGIFAVRTAVKVGVIASLLSALIGIILGTLAGYFGGWIDDFVVWIYSTFASMPTLLFILSFALLVNKGFLFPPLATLFDWTASVFNTDPGMMAIYIGIGFTGWVSLCRTVRAETLKLRESAFIQSAQTLGFSSFRIITRHIVPNLFHLVIIYFTMRFAYAIMTEVIVSYLGLGVQMAPSWGTMIADGQQRLWQGIWWEVGAATGFMFFLVLSLHLFGDALRDTLDPRLRF